MPLHPLLDDFPVVIEWPIAWADMDAFNHVNNIIFFRYFENARIAYFNEIGYMDHREKHGIGPILADTYCRLRLPLTYPDTVLVGARVPEVKEDRFTVDYRIVSTKLDGNAADGNCTIVNYDYNQGCKAAIPEVIRERIERLEGRS